jgi:Superfamily II DNA/RNA helicases, SNF2 family
VEDIVMAKEPIDFGQTFFCNNWNATFGKLPLKLSVVFDYDGDNASIKLSLYIGMDKLYRVNDIDEFLDRMEKLQPLYFSKYFILEPEKMCFEGIHHNLIEFLRNMKLRHLYDTSRFANPQYNSSVEAPLEAGVSNNKLIQNKAVYFYDEINQNKAKFNSSEIIQNNSEFYGNEVMLQEADKEIFLDTFWESMELLTGSANGNKYRFQSLAPVKITVEKEKDNSLMVADYSEYGDFEPLTLSFRYLFLPESNTFVKLSRSSAELFRNLYVYKNDEYRVVFRINRRENKLFQKNFLDKYRNEVKLTLDPRVEKEIESNCLISRIYFDVAPKGIISKIEFCYGDKIINPLVEASQYREIREFTEEMAVREELESYGFTEYGRLFLLNDTEKIIKLLTEEPRALKKLAQVYYSQDFKKLYVRNLNIDSFSLSDNGSVIHMNLNLENVSDEELAELLDSIREKKKYYLLRNGSIINLSSVDSQKFIDFINSLNISGDRVQGGVFEIPLSRSMYINQYLQEKGMDEVKVDERLGGIIHKLNGDKEDSILLETTVHKQLRDYQRVGVQWLKTMAEYSFGGILADDMGLGKTLQILAFLSEEKDESRPALVVAPTSLLYNWKREAERFTPERKILLITGAKEKRRLLLTCCNDYNLIITSYGILKNDIEQFQEISFSYVIVDEAQNIKNPMTLNAGSVKSLRAKCCFALTGTPIENRLTELWSIFDFIMPGYLLSQRRFAQTYEEEILRGRNKERLMELSKLIKPFILRRLKKDVLDELPDKIITNYVSEMTEQQAKLYAAYYKDFKRELEDRLDQYGLEHSHIELLAALTRLRQICAHPGTFLENYVGGSGKLMQAMQLIADAVSSGHSVLLFSQFTKLLKLLQTELIKSGVKYYYLDGTMKAEERNMEVDSFNNDSEAVFLISLKAGGTGLNLMKADIVIHFDPWWNPAVEDQASDRSHRIGQKNVVQVYKLLTEGTIEEKIAQLQDKKRELLDSIITPGESFIDQLTEEEIKELWGMEA